MRYHALANLAITIPTYNRKNILKIWLKRHANLMFQNGVRIHIQDNLSSDGTKLLLKSWKKKFSNISYSVNKHNVSGPENLEIALNAVNYNFVWLVGDSYEIDSTLLNKILSIIKNTSPLFLITNLEGRKKNFIKSKVNFNVVCKELSGILSCLSCVVYNKKKLGKIIFKEKYWSMFPHTIFILNQLRSKNIKAYWVPSSIKVFRSVVKKNWASTPDVFEIGCKNWITSIDSVIGLKVESRKKAHQAFAKITNLFSLKGSVWLRSQGLLTLNSINHYKIYLKKSIGKNYLLLYPVALIPVGFLKTLKEIYYKCRLKV